VKNQSGADYMLKLFQQKSPATPFFDSAS